MQLAFFPECYSIMLTLGSGSEHVVGVEGAAGLESTLDDGLFLPPSHTLLHHHLAPSTLYWETVTYRWGEKTLLRVLQHVKTTRLQSKEVNCTTLFSRKKEELPYVGGIRTHCSLGERFTNWATRATQLVGVPAC